MLSSFLLIASCVAVSTAVPQHLLDAQSLVSAVTANGNSSYDNGPSETHYIVWDGANSAAKTSGPTFFRFLLQHSYDVSNTMIERWTGSPKPSSMQWWATVYANDQFQTLNLTFDSLQVGDIIFVNSSSAGVANIWLVSGLPVGPIAAQSNATVKTYTVEIIDSSSSYHGNWDTRYNPPARRSNFGIGRGYVKLIFDGVTGQLTGYTNSNATSTSLMGLTAQRRASFARLTLNVSLFEDAPIVRADVNDMPPHLADALEFLGYLTVSNNNTYQYGTQYQVWDGSNSATVCTCSEFVRMTMEHTYVAEGTSATAVRNAWKAGFQGNSQPKAKYWYQNIVAQVNFTRVLSVEDVMPGDIVAMTYPDAWNDYGDTGHVMMVLSAPAEMSPRALPVVGGTLQYAVEILDCSKSPHGDFEDTRYPDRNGTGSGVFRVYVDAETKAFVGYSWSRSKSSELHMMNEVQFAFGRIHSDFLNYVQPTTLQPTIEPTAQPTAEPTVQPTAEPTEQPTAEPTEEPEEPSESIEESQNETAPSDERAGRFNSASLNDYIFDEYDDDAHLHVGLASILLLLVATTIF